MEEDYSRYFEAPILWNRQVTRDNIAYWEKKGQVEILTRITGSSWGIVTPHGGIEIPPTLIKKAARLDFTYYIFNVTGIGPDIPYQEIKKKYNKFHIPSIHFVERKAEEVSKACNFFLCLHSHRGHDLIIGGRHTKAANALREFLNGFDFPIAPEEQTPGKLAGTHPNNFTNASKQNMGIQLEVPRRLVLAGRELNKLARCLHNFLIERESICLSCH